MAVEFHSLWKTYNMTGWRIGSVVGNSDVVAGIGKIKEKKHRLGGPLGRCRMPESWP